MPRTPDLLDAMTHARLVSDNLAAAYYLDVGSGGQRTISQIKALAADDQFIKLAAALGYRVEKIEAPAEAERQVA